MSQRQYFRSPQQGNAAVVSNQRGQQPQQPQGFQVPQFNMPQFQTPDLSGLQFGGGTSIEGVGSVQAPDQSSTANALLGVLGNAYGDQLGLTGSLAQTQGGIDQARIGATSNDYGNELALQGQQYTADSALRQAELVADIQKELGIYQSDRDLEGDKYGADQQLAGIQAQSDASRYGADQQLAGVRATAEFGALPAILQMQRFNQSFPFFQQLAAQLLGGGNSGGTGGLSATGVGNGSEALNRQIASNAQQYASSQGDQGYSGGSPQAGAYGANNDYARMVADTEARHQIPLAYARENRDAELAALAAKNDALRAQSSQLSPIMQLLGQYV